MFNRASRQAVTSSKYVKQLLESLEPQNVGHAMIAKQVLLLCCGKEETGLKPFSVEDIR